MIQILWAEMQKQLERMKREFIPLDELNPLSLDQTFPSQRPEAPEQLIMAHANESVGCSPGASSERDASGPRALEPRRANSPNDSESEPLRNAFGTGARSAAEKSELLRRAERQAHELFNDPRWDDQWYLVRVLKLNFA